MEGAGQVEEGAGPRVEVEDGLVEMWEVRRWVESVSEGGDGCCGTARAGPKRRVPGDDGGSSYLCRRQSLGHMMREEHSTAASGKLWSWTSALGSCL